MTFCKLLAEKTMPNGDTVSAWENTDKGAVTPRYEVVVAHGADRLVGWGDMYPCARTTWRKKFREIAGV